MIIYLIATSTHDQCEGNMWFEFREIAFHVYPSVNVNRARKCYRFLF